MPRMKGNCPICHKVGYLILEKPRDIKTKTHWDIWEKSRKLYPNLKDWELQQNGLVGIYSRNIPHKRYIRKHRSYYRFSHYKLNPCYIGCLETAIKRLEDKAQILEDSFDSHSKQFRHGVQAIKEYFNKNYIPDPNDSKYIYSVILKSRNY